MKRFRGGLVLKAHRLVLGSNKEEGLGVIQKKRRNLGERLDVHGAVGVLADLEVLLPLALPRRPRPRPGPACLFVTYRFYIVYRQSPVGPVDHSFRALSRRLKFTWVINLLSMLYTYISAMVGVPHRPLLPSLLTLLEGCRL